MRQNGNLDFAGTGTATGIRPGVAGTDAVNYNQLQAVLTGRDFKDSVRVASTGNVTVSAPGGTFDGVTLAAGDRVLLKNQTQPAENGPYVFNGASVPLTRSADGAQGQLTAGAEVTSTEGTANGGATWLLTTPDPITVGTTGLSWTQTNAQTLAGTGLTKSGNTLSLSTPVSPANGGTGATSASGARAALGALGKFAQDVGDGTATTFNVQHNLGTTDVASVSLILKSTGDAEGCDWRVVDANTVRLSGWTAAPSAGAYRVVVAA